MIYKVTSFQVEKKILRFTHMRQVVVERDTWELAVEYALTQLEAGDLVQIAIPPIDLDAADEKHRAACLTDLQAMHDTEDQTKEATKANLQTNAQLAFPKHIHQWKASPNVPGLYCKFCGEVR